MRELFKNQIEENKIVDEEMLSKMEYKFYENGEPIKVGDKILFSLLETDKTESEITYKLIALTEEQFDFFVCENPDRDGLPVPVLKYCV
jgi:translation initiation factor IF-1